VLVKEGSYVKAGQPLIKLDDVLTQAQYMSATTSYEKAQKDWERARDLRRQEVISNTELEAARLQSKAAEATYITSRKQYHNSVIVAPIAGVVVSCPVTVGSMVGKDDVVANVVDMSLFKLELNVDEPTAFRLKVGNVVTITTDVYPGVTFSGRIDSISAKCDAAHNYPVKLIIQNNHSQYPLKSGMYGKATFDMLGQEALVIPRTALVGSVKQPQVFVVEGDQAKLREIVVGNQVGTKLTIVQGLKEGDRIVYNGQENIKDNARVEIVR